MDADDEWTKLPTIAKVQHKLWNARVCGYEEAHKLFFNETNEKSPIFNEYLGIMKKFVNDPHAGAQEKALDTVLLFLEIAAVAPKCANDICSSLITKCLSSTRSKTKDKSIECLLMLIEIERHEVVLDELLKGLSNKNPKVVVGCLQTLREALNLFGPSVVSIKPLFKEFGRLFDDRDKNVRAETKNLVVEVYRWVGLGTKDLLKDIKPVVLTELNELFSCLPNEKPVKTRYLRSQRPKEVSSCDVGDAGATSQAISINDLATEQIDIEEMIPPVEVLSKIPSVYWQQISEKKWQDRRDALESVEKITNVPNIVPGDFSDLVKTLLLVVSKDTNVVLVAMAAKVLSQLANGLKSKYSPYAQQTIQACLAKFKERKPNVVQALRDAVDAASKATTLDHMMEDIVEALGHKTPSVRAEAALFLSRIFRRCSPAMLTKKVLKTLTAPLCTTSTDTVPEVRENSFAALGAAMFVVSAKNIQPFLSELDSIRLAKINECCELISNEVGSSSMTDRSNTARSGPAAPPKSATGPRRGAPPVTRPNTAPSGDQQSVSETVAKPTSNASGAKKKSGSVHVKPSTVMSEKSKPTIPTETLLTDEQLEQKSSELFGETLLKQLCDTNWKERLQSMEQILSNLKTMSSDSLPTQVLLRTVLRKPGLKDTNFQVLKLRIEYINSVLSCSNLVSSSMAELLIPDLLDKIGDIKVGDVVKATLTTLTERTSLELVGGNLMQTIFQIKNPRSQSEGLSWLAQSILEFGFSLSAKEVGPFLKIGLNATNQNVRQSTISLAGTIHLFLGDALKNLLSDEKPAIVTLLNTEFSKNEGQRPPPRTRSTALNAANAAPAESKEVDGAGGDETALEEPDSEALLPRVDISSMFTPELMSLLASKAWKERLEALNNIEKFVSPSKMIDGANGKLQEPLTVIAKASGDVNKNLAKQVLGILAAFAKSMPKSDAVTYIRFVEPPILLCLGDSKVQVREAAVAALTAWQSRVPVLSMLENDILSDALKLENPFLRTELLRWLLGALSSLPSNALRRNAAEFGENLLPQIFSCLEDRNPDTRKQAQLILPALIQSLGWENVMKAANRLKATSKDSVLPHLEKARELVIANQPVADTKGSNSSPKAVRGKGGKGGTNVKPAVPAASVTTPVENDDQDSSSLPSVPSVKPPESTKKKVDGKKSINTKKSSDEQSASSVILPSNKSARTARLADEKKRKLLKWDFDAPTRDHVQQLNQLFASAGASTELHSLLFHTDFRQHVKAVDQLSRLLDSPEGEDATMMNVDLILKWMVLRFFETNPVVLARCLDYVTKLFVYMCEAGLNLSEHEGTSFLPYLVLKVGDPKDVIRQNIRAIFKLVVNLYPPSRLYTFLSNGTKSKTSKTRQECLDEMGLLIERFGINVCQPSLGPALKSIAQQIGDRDSGVRTAALNTLVSAYGIVGEQLWKIVGDLPEKDRSMLEERIKRSGRQPGVSSGESSEPKSASIKTTGTKRDPSDTRRPPEIRQSDYSRQPPVSSARARARAMLNELGDLSPEKAPTMPALIQLDADIDDLFQPVEMPNLKTHSRQPVLNALLRTSPDTASAITMVVTAISSSDLLISCHALAEIDTVLRDEKWYLLLNHVNQILMLITMQLRQVNSRYVSDSLVTEEQLRTLVRCHLATIDSLFNRPTLGREATRETLRELIQALLHMMLDEKTTEIPDGENVIRAINSLCVRILETANGTRLLSALIRLLHECVSNGHYGNRFTCSVMKSIWRITKGMSSSFNNYSLDVILLDCHHFLKAFPAASWSSRKSDVPLRTIKTLLHTLCGLQGPSILQFLNTLPNRDDSELEAYLIRTLKTLSGVQLNPIHSQKPGDSDGNSKFVLSAVTREKLTLIFKKVASKKPDEGLNELYDFTQLYPDVDLSSYLTNTSQFFQTYIKQALSNIAVERARQARLRSGDDPNISPQHPQQPNGISIHPNWSRDFESDVQDEQPANPKLFMNRLALLRQQLGLGGVSTTDVDEGPLIFGENDGSVRSPALENTLKNMGKPVSVNSGRPGGVSESPDENVQPGSEPRVTMSATELMDLKRRLERIKSGQK